MARAGLVLQLLRTTTQQEDERRRRIPSTAASGRGCRRLRLRAAPTPATDGAASRYRAWRRRRRVPPPPPAAAPAGVAPAWIHGAPGAAPPASDAAAAAVPAGVLRVQAVPAPAGHVPAAGAVWLPGPGAAGKSATPGQPQDDAPERIHAAAGWILPAAAAAAAATTLPAISNAR